MGEAFSFRGAASFAHVRKFPPFTFTSVRPFPHTPPRQLETGTIFCHKLRCAKLAAEDTPFEGAEGDVYTCRSRIAVGAYGIRPNAFPSIPSSES